MQNLGVPARGDPATGVPLNRETGEGFVLATEKHDYADALRRGNPVTLLVSETTGALSATFVHALRELAKHARAKTTHDSTRYGTARTSPRAFYVHHVAAISSAIVRADAITVQHAAAAMSFKLSIGIMP